ncbi:MAG: cysteine peptidase family C39 domain-containing protein [Planctomycetota bacterium]
MNRRRHTAILVLLPVLFFACGCSTYRGEARDFDPSELREPGWISAHGVEPVLQERQDDCGSAALAMMLRFWGQPASIEEISKACALDDGKGIRAGALRNEARSRGLKAYVLTASFPDLVRELGLGRPVLVGLVKPYASGGFAHFEVVVALNPGLERIVTLDPGSGWRSSSFEGFAAEWRPSGCLALVMFASPRNLAGPPQATASGERR